MREQAVITVGGGRGFIVYGPRFDRLVITAAHCLPHFPPCHPGAYLEERMYAALLGPLGESPTVWDACLFADPTGDIAILGAPDNQELSEEYDAYSALIDAPEPLPMSDPPMSMDVSPAKLLSLSQEWFRCSVRHIGGPLYIFDAEAPIAAGMSGSPIITDNSSAIGVVCISSGGGEGTHFEGGPNPRLAYNLPAWAFRR